MDEQEMADAQQQSKIPSDMTLIKFGQSLLALGVSSLVDHMDYGS